MGQEESSTEQKTEVESETTNFRNKNLTMIPIQSILPYLELIVNLDLTGNCINALPSNIPNLRVLVLASNKLTSIDDGLINSILTYPKLEVIDVSLNDLTVIPDQILQIRTLTRLNIFGNRISDIDCSNSRIITIDCGKNYFNKPPKCSTNIEYLCLDMNFFNSLDISIPSLIRLSYKVNQITSMSPNLFFPQLQVLDISCNKLHELPDFSRITPNLKVFNASCNEITNFPKFPQSIIEIDLQTNQIETLPNELKNYSSLVTLNLSDNRLTVIPEVPRYIFTLELYNNNITTINKSVTVNLRYLSIYNNRLKEIPSFEKSKIRDLYFFSNYLTKINVSFIKDTVTKLDLTNNFIKELPDELFDPNKFPNLTNIIVARNRIRELPPSFKKSEIISINISCNPISELPSEFPKTIEKISVANCGLSRLPESLTNLEDLVELDASCNDLSSIPYMQYLEILHLSMNKIVFFPKISTNLVSLDLSMNFIDRIPNNLKFPKLQYADFSYNKLINFPNNFTAPRLYSLKVSHNPIISTVFIDSLFYPRLNLVDFSESKMTIKMNSNKFVIEHSDGSLMPSNFTRFIHCDNYVAVSRIKGIREQTEDAFVIRTSFQKNLNLFGLWDARMGGEAASVGALELTKYINNCPFEFTEKFFEKFCNKMKEEIGEDCLFDVISMALCACNKSKILFASCGNMSIMIVGEKEKKLNEHEKQDKAETNSDNHNFNENNHETENVSERDNFNENNHETEITSENHNENENKGETENVSENDIFNENKGETENVSENDIFNENKGETENADGSHSFSDCVYVDAVYRSSDLNGGFKLASPEPRFVCRIRDFRPSDRWVIAASQGVTDFISPADIGQIAKSAESSSELAYKIVATVRESSSKDSASVIAYSIKEANSS